MIALIKQRRAVYPSAYSDQPITKTEIETVLESANWAPTHKRTEPWRFVIMHSHEDRAKLGNHMAEYYKLQVSEEEFAEGKYQKPIKNCALSGCIIAIILHRDPQERLPEWEELCAVACAVQNIWLSCTALQIGGYWSTHGSINTAQKLLQLADNERCVGYFFMGHLGLPLPIGTRGDMAQKVKWGL
jgi:nitroreductase